MSETYTTEEMRAIEDIQALEAALGRLAQVGENPMILNRVRRIHIRFLEENKDLIKRYNEALAGQAKE